MKQCIEDLQELGLSRNEAKVYLSLLRFNPVTGYQLSKQTGIRRSVIYDVLQRLIDRGAIYKIAEDPVKYAPVPHDKFLEGVKSNFERSVNSIKEKLEHASFSFAFEYIYHITGARNVRNEIVHIIDNAEHELLIELWMAQVEELKPTLLAASRRGVKIFTMLFSDTHIDPLGHMFYHDYMPLEVVETRLKGQHSIVVRDNQEALIGKMLQEDTTWAVTTRDAALVMVAREFIIHDIMIDLLIRKFGKETLLDVWLFNPDMHSLVLDRLSTSKESGAEAAGPGEQK
jgi:HTH-type transcriptional regulator, sugar sensing transcriptional regulator